MRFIIPMLFLVVHTAIWTSDTTVWGQETVSDFTPPISKNGEKFKNTAKSRFQRTDARYLPPDQKLNAKSQNWLESTKRETLRLTPEEIAARNKQMKVLAIIALLILAVGFLLYWLDKHTGGKLFGWLKRKERFTGTANLQPNSSILDAAENPRRSLDELSKITDPEIGLHELLMQALVQATWQNNIPLRRSLTSREVLRRVPISWPHRPILHALVTHSELVLFGGRGIDMNDYNDALALAQPMFTKGRNK